MAVGELFVNGINLTHELYWLTWLQLLSLWSLICFIWPDNIWRGLCLASWNQKITWLVDCCGRMTFFSTLVAFFFFCTIFIIFQWTNFMFGIQVGGVHSHLISRVQRDKSRMGCFMSQNDIMMTVFPMFQQHIEPHLVHAHVSRLQKNVNLLSIFYVSQFLSIINVLPFC